MTTTYSVVCGLKTIGTKLHKLILQESGQALDDKRTVFGLMLFAE